MKTGWPRRDLSRAVAHGRALAWRRELAGPAYERRSECRYGRAVGCFDLLTAHGTPLPSAGGSGRVGCELRFEDPFDDDLWDGVQSQIEGVDLVAAFGAHAPTVHHVLFDPVETSARNAVALASDPPFPSGSWWPKPGKPDQHSLLELDPNVTARVLAVAAELTGV